MASSLITLIIHYFTSKPLNFLSLAIYDHGKIFNHDQCLTNSLAAFCHPYLFYSEGIREFGTGGRMLLSLTTLMGHFENLEELRLENLLLDRFEAPRLLDSIFQSCAETLLTLSLINCANFGYFFMHCHYRTVVAKLQYVKNALASFNLGVP